jgi:hypothetical protein
VKLPPNFAREFVYASPSAGTAGARGWKIRIGNKAVFIASMYARRPGRIRSIIENVLGIDPRPMKSQEELVTAKARTRAKMKRAFRNRIAKSPVPMIPPWRKPKTVEAIKNEERSLDILQKWQRMGEYRR